jgi:hypothetical protein
VPSPGGRLGNTELGHAMALLYRETLPCCGNGFRHHCLKAPVAIPENPHADSSSCPEIADPWKRYALEGVGSVRLFSTSVDSLCIRTDAGE